MDKRFAAIDLGTNSCRLLIADKNGKYLLQTTSPVRLGEGMVESCAISEASFERALECFMEFRKYMDEYNVGKYRAIATSACRNAENSKKFVKEIKEKTNIQIEIVDGYEEAELNLIGALSNADKNKKYVVIFDIGGGSTEITLAKNSINPEIIYSISVPWGARNSSEAFGFGAYDEEKAARLRFEILRYAEDFLLNSNYEKYKEDACIIATSSSGLRLVSFQNNVKEYDREKADGKKIDALKLDETFGRLYKMTIEELADNPSVGRKRAGIFIPACVIFDTIAKGLEAREITASLKSAKDGIIKAFLDGEK